MCVLCTSIIKNKMGHFMGWEPDNLNLRLARVPRRVTCPRKKAFKGKGL